ncbi:MAG TPA: YncE family protein [Thermoplasmata archaeon]|nr:YncE family protein [Thermoplasmata archaeon]
MIYVPNHFAASVSVINGTCANMGTVVLPNGSEPWAAAYNPSNKEIYVTDSASYSTVGGTPGRDVYVIHNLSLVRTIRSTAFGGGTWSIAWDPSANLMLCVSGHGLLVGISGNSINGSIHIGNGLSEGMAYDSRANEMLMTLRAYDNVTGVNASHPFLGSHLNIRVGKGPVGIASDPITGYDYVTDFQASSVTVINGSGGYLASIPVKGGPVGVAVDSAKNEIFVADDFANKISVIKGLSVVRTLTFAPPNNYFVGVVYDFNTKLVYVTGLNYKVFIVT